jgi:hypothetical protein
VPKPARWLSAINAVVLSQALDISNKGCLLRLNSENKKIARYEISRVSKTSSPLGQRAGCAETHLNTTDSV